MKKSVQNPMENMSHLYVNCACHISATSATNLKQHIELKHPNSLGNTVHVSAS